MTTHPVNIPVSGIQATPNKIAPQTSTPIVKSKSTGTYSSNVSVTAPKAKAQFIATEAASLDISAEGVNRLISSNRAPIQNREEAKSLMNEVTENIKQNTDQTYLLHSNLRAMRVNHLVFD